MIRTKTRFFAFFLALSLCTATTPASAAELPEQWKEGIQHFEAIKAFNPGQDAVSLMKPVTKAEFLKMLFLGAGFQPKTTVRLIPTPFTDVPRDAWYLPFLSEAMRIGLVARKPGEFQPTAFISRSEALKMSFFLYGIPTPRISEQPLLFRDVTDEEEGVVRKSVEMGLLEPRTDRIFGARQPIARGELAEMLTILDGAVGKLQSAEQQTPSNDRFSLLNRVYDQMRSSFYHQERIDDEKMIYSAIDGMVNSANDPYTVFMPPEKSSNFQDELNGELDGIGAYVGKENGKVIIVAPIKGSPADKAGLQPHDIIEKVDGTDITGLALFDAVAKIKGKRGTSVKLSIDRNTQKLEVTIVRDHILVESTKYELRKGVAIITLSQFGAKTVSELSVIIDKMKTDNPRAIILDLRGNPGGFLNAAISILGFFLPDGSTVVQVKYPNMTVGEKSFGEPKLKDIPLIVLIDKNSASASEIVSGTLQDYGRAKLIGEKSFGKGTVQQINFFDDGSSLKVTIAEWLTGKGNSINKTGVKPDIAAVDDPNTKDLDEAIQAALNQVQ